jgi:nicotinamide phosphoribosyltransferase
MNSLLLTDGYKVSHHQMYPQDTTLVYSNFTPRSNKYAPKGCDEVVVFGTQLMMKQLHEHFETNFFKKPKKEVIDEIKNELSMYLNAPYDVTHFEELHDLGYLPIHVKALEEGTLCPIRIPMLTIYNTEPGFYWVTNYLETIISNLLWKPMTSATIAHAYKKVLYSYARRTDSRNADEVIKWQAHDFSMRGMDSIDATMASGLGHLTSFYGTDSLPTIWGARKYYNEKGFVAGSVPATEHSVMCSGTKEGELETFKRLLKTFPEGILSVVSDTWDLWNVITIILPQLKEQILSRNGKLVIRPDSGDPVDILCGKLFTDSGSYLGNRPDMALSGDNSPENKGVIELLWDIFGGTVNEQDCRVLNPCIGAIYGDSITIDRAEEICKRLEAKGFASTNVVLGVGSFTYQYNTRDTFGFAMKATFVEKEEVFYASPESLEPGLRTVGYPIFKDPVTDDGTKKSAVGLLKVVHGENGKLALIDNCTWEEEGKGLLKTLYKDGMFYGETTLTEIRERLSKY